MFDGIKIIDLSVLADLTDDGTSLRLSLLQNPLLDFKGQYSQTTGEINTDYLTATDRGLTFTLFPATDNRPRARVELKGSLHRYYRNGLHNADDFTAVELLAALDQLVTTYGLNPFTSKLNNVEFGVNVRLPFPVERVLQNLISYKYRPFYRDTRGVQQGNETLYYQCMTQRYVVKLYDKGKQYGLPGHVLRVEVKVLKMEFFKDRKIHLNQLNDLLTVTNYGPLGALLVETFNNILFDEPSINPATLTTIERSLYLNGRNPRFWTMPERGTDEQSRKEYERRRKQLQRDERRFRSLLDQHRPPGQEWQGQTATLIGETWQRLTTVDHSLQKAISDRRAVWRNIVEGAESKSIAGITAPETCPKLTGGKRGVYCETTEKKPVEPCPKLTKPDLARLSQTNPLYLGVNRDIELPFSNTTAAPGYCVVTGVALDNPARRFVSATMLRNDPALLNQLNRQFTTYRKGSKEDQPTRTAHNLRNAYNNSFNNPRNNLRRAVLKIHRQPTLFDVAETLRLTPDQRAALDYWKGTGREVRF